MVELKRPEIELSLEEKDAKLRSLIADYGDLIVAYSGGGHADAPRGAA